MGGGVLGREGGGPYEFVFFLLLARGSGKLWSGFFCLLLVTLFCFPFLFFSFFLPSAT